MPAPARPSIRLLAAEPNARGDMFTRLSGDYLMALGYEVVHSDLPRAGREIDLIAIHRTERRRAGRVQGDVDAHRRHAPQHLPRGADA
jgi:hypothetical protein